MNAQLIKLNKIVFYLYQYLYFNYIILYNSLMINFK